MPGWSKGSSRRSGRRQNCCGSSRRAVAVARSSRASRIRPVTARGEGREASLRPRPPGPNRLPVRRVSRQVNPILDRPLTTTTLAGSGGIWRCSDKSLTLDDPTSATGTRGGDRLHGGRVAAVANRVRSHAIHGGCANRPWSVRALVFSYRSCCKSYPQWLNTSMTERGDRQKCHAQLPFFRYSHWYEMVLGDRSGNYRRHCGAGSCRVPYGFDSRRADLDGSSPRQGSLPQARSRRGVGRHHRLRRSRVPVLPHPQR